MRNLGSISARVSLVLAVASFGTWVSAQEPTEEAAQGAAEETEPQRRAPDVEEITVTGSYIRGTSTEGPSPVDILERGEIEKLGVPRLSDALQRLPYNMGSFGRGTDTFTGINDTANINLRGLGASRTLILVDGKRSVIGGELAGGGNPYINLQQYPKIIIGRTEILKEGAAATYGSDAIAGVVNLITRRHFEGFEFRSDYLTTAESSPHENKNFEALYGWASGTGDTHWTLAGAYYEQEKFRSEQRGFTRFHNDQRSFGFSSVANPGAYITLGPLLNVPPEFEDRFPDGVPDVFPLSALGLNGPVIVRDADCGPATGTILNGGTCGYTFTPFFDLAVESKRYNLFTQFSHHFSESLELWADIGYFRQETDKVGLSPAFPILNFDRDGNIPVDNPGNYLGVPIVAGYRGRPLATAFGGIGDVRPEGDGSIVSQRYVGGFRGKVPESVPLFNAVGADWSYEASVQYSREVGDTSAPDQLQKRWNNALHGFGGSDCEVGEVERAWEDPNNLQFRGDQEGSNCAYWNPFGNAITAEPGETGVGGLPLRNTQAMWRWFSDETSTATTTTLTVYDWLVSGELMDLPAGPLGLAFGMQWRQEEYDVSRNAESTFPVGVEPDSFIFLQGGTVFKSDQDVWSLFGELNVPLNDRVELQLAVRHEDYGRDIGKSVDPKVALAIHPTDHLTLRTSMSTTFRAPSLSQQLSQRTALASIQDTQFVGVDEGGGALTRVSSGFRAVDAAGNPALKPEEAIVFNTGIVGRDFLVEGLDFTVDYYRIKMDDVLGVDSANGIVARENAVNIANQQSWPTLNLVDEVINLTGAPGQDEIPDSVCVTLAQVAEAEGDCFYNDSGRIDRLFADGLVNRVKVAYDNFASVKTDGLDVSGRYSWEMPGVGEMSFVASGSHVIRYDVEGGPGQPSGSFDGSANNNNFVQPLPKFRLFLTLNWARDNHSAYLNWNHISPYEDDANASRAGGVSSPRKISQFTTVDVGYAYDLNLTDATVSFGIQNLFDQDPPYMREDLNYDARTHDPYGRKYYANLLWRWGVD